MIKAAGLTLLLAIVAAGCKSTTETGYEPRKLGDSAAVQRGYYARPFSPEARAAAAERQVEFSNRRPTDWRP